MRDATSNIQANAKMAKKKQTLITNLFQQPFSEGELMNIFLPKEIELCKSCSKLPVNFKLKPQNFESYHREFLCFKTEKKCKKKNHRNNNNNNNNNDNNNNDNNDNNNNDNNKNMNF